MDSEMVTAVQTGNIESLYVFIQGDPYFLERMDQIPFVDTPLHLAACTEHLHLAFVQEMINLKPSFARKLNQAGLSPMHLALKKCRVPIVLRLLKFDKDLVRVKGKEGLTPLHHAVQIGNSDILIKFLEICPEAIQDVNAREETAFHIALNHKQYEAFEILVGWLRRSCHKAAQSWEKELLMNGDFEGNTVLHIAVVQNRPLEVKLLLENFSHDQINVENSVGLTALAMATSEYEKDGSKSNNQQIYYMLSNSGKIGSLVQNAPHSSVGRLIHSSLPKMPNSSAGGFNFIRSLFLEKPNSSSTQIDSLRSKMSRYDKLKTAIVRGKSGLSEGMRNTFLIVTVLIITATYNASLNPPKKDQNGGNGGTGGSSSYSSATATTTGQGSSSASSSSSSISGGNYDPLGIKLPDVYSLFWLFNTLTFWASVWLTAVLLPSDSSMCLFLLITLSLFGSCYMLLIVAVSSDLGSYFQLFSKNPNNWYYSISVVNYISSTLLALFVSYRIARYVCLKLAKTRRALLCLILFVSFLFVALSVLFPAMLFSEIMWRNFLPAMYEAAEAPRPAN